MEKYVSSSQPGEYFSEYLLEVNYTATDSIRWTGLNCDVLCQASSPAQWLAFIMHSFLNFPLNCHFLHVVMETNRHPHFTLWHSTQNLEHLQFSASHDIQQFKNSTKVPLEKLQSFFLQGSNECIKWKVFLLMINPQRIIPIAWKYTCCLTFTFVHLHHERTGLCLPTWYTWYRRAPLGGRHKTEVEEKGKNIWFW